MSSVWALLHTCASPTCCATRSCRQKACAGCQPVARSVQTRPNVASSAGKSSFTPALLVVSFSFSFSFILLPYLLLFQHPLLVSHLSRCRGSLERCRSLFCFLSGRAYTLPRNDPSLPARPRIRYKSWKRLFKINRASLLTRHYRRCIVFGFEYPSLVCLAFHHNAIAEGDHWAPADPSPCHISALCAI